MPRRFVKVSTTNKNPLRGNKPARRIRTFPKPKGVPNDYIAEFSDTGAGLKYVKLNDRGTYIRVMPGKPHSPWLHQREPYICEKKYGKSLDKFGNAVSRESPEAHIPINEYVYKGK